MKTRDQFFQELFNRPPTPEEQHHFDRLGSLMSLAQDDSMWYVILVNEFYDNRLKSRLNDIEAVSNSAAKAALVKIGEAVEEKAEEIAAIKNQGFLWRSWGMMMSMIVLLGAICVNAGYVMGSGKYPFWLAPENTLSKIVGYFLNVPSGWILLLGSSPFLSFSVEKFFRVRFHNKKELASRNRQEERQTGYEGNRFIYFTYSNSLHHISNLLRQFIKELNGIMTSKFRPG